MNTYSVGQRDELAQLFDALGHPRRIAIFLALQKTGAKGLKFGDLATYCKIAEPSLAHHLKMMKKGGLIQAKSKGSATVLTLNLAQAEQAQKFLSL
ncbi:MAG: winged helix-turn-helix transcriptional regulator [Robiginitomaculum sp.]|nr:winged helix-turn-helix transcriptional regulator [Robiginitomaculum sp.]